MIFSFVILFFSQIIIMSHIQKIKNHLELSYKLEAAVDDVLSGKDVQATAISYGLNKKILNRKLDIIRKTTKYIQLKSKFESAVAEYLNGRATIKAAANHYGISQTILTKEIVSFKKHKILGIALYEYDRPIQRKAFFTFREEMLLLRDLFLWKNMFQPYCFCQLCAMDRLLSLANQYVENSGRVHLKRWNKTKQTGLKWLIDFEMRFSNSISTTFRPNCMKIPTVSRTKLTSKSKSLVNGSRDLYRKDFDQLRIYNVKDMSTQTIREITSAGSDDVNDQPMDLRTSQRILGEKN